MRVKCPKCHMTIEEASTACPHCGAGLSAVIAEESEKRVDLIFCEGCGARLTAHDRTCPKCSRPAPGILSSKTAASDLAAGKTASFPRLTQNQIDVDLPRDTSLAADIIAEAADPNATSVLPAMDGGEGGNGSGKPKKKPRKVHADEDAYHKHRRKVPKALIWIVVLALMGGAGYWFITNDPMGVMPGFYDWFGKSAEDMFPSRQKAENASADTSSNNTQAQQEQSETSSSVATVSDDQILEGDALYERLLELYNDVIEYNDDSQIGQVISDFNGSYASSTHSVREEASAFAYDLRDRISQTINDIDDVKMADDSEYGEDREHVRKLAQWMYERVDAICASWDVSLAIPDGESVSAHEEEILQPLQDAGSTALNSFLSNISRYKPTKHSS